MSQRRGCGGAPQREVSRRSYLTLIALAALLVVAAWSYYPVARMHYQEQREKTRLEAELDSVRRRNAELRERVDRLKTPEGVEEVARKSLGFVKEGENLYLVLDDTQTPAATVAGPVASKMETGEEGLWQRALDAIFGFKE